MNAMPPIARLARLATLVGFAVLVSECSTNPALENAAQPTVDRPGKVITRADIAKTNWRTAWEIIQNATHLQLVAMVGGSEVTVLHRGRSSTRSNVPLLFIDGVRAGNLVVLRQIPASSINEIRVLSGLEASISYVGGTAAGVIEITTISN